MSTPPTLYLIDGHSLTFRAYYALNKLTGPAGQPTGAVYVFLRIMLKFMDDHKPTHLAVVFDTGRPTFRSEMYPEYKANRQAAPEDFNKQMEWIYQLLRHMKIPIFDMHGYEADDLIATMVETMKSHHGNTVIVSADKDLMQLVAGDVTMLRPGNTNEMKRIDPAGVFETMGVHPHQIIDYLALLGDSSDNIPGVPGIGGKTAAALLAEFGSLDAILERTGEIKRDKLRNSLLENAEQARLARRLATVKSDVPLENWNFDLCALPADLWPAEAQAFMHELGFQSVLRERNLTTLPPPPPPKPAENEPEPVYRALTNAAGLAAWVAEAQQAEWLALDTETTGTDPMKDALVGMSLSFKKAEAVYIPIGHSPGLVTEGQLTLAEVRAALTPLLAGPQPSAPAPKLVGHHAKFDWKVLIQHGFNPAPPAFDTMIASYMLDPDKASGHGLKGLGREICNIHMAPITELIGTGRNQITMSEVAIETATIYAGRDADVTLRLFHCLREKLAALPTIERLFNELEMPLATVLLEMEMGGFNIDVPVLRTLSGEIDSEMHRLSKEIFESAGHPFNIGSPKQVATVLYEELQLKTGKQGKTGFSTNEDELERLRDAHPIARLILDYRGVEKLKSTYIEALPRMVNPRTGRIHTSFNQTIAATGRLSSTDPNLQNIPIRSNMGRAIRRAFIADRQAEDGVLVKADYSQIELRILAHISGDETLRRAYQEGRDIHRQTASEIFNVDQKDVTSEMRAQSKVVNFGIVYGMSAHGLSQQLGIGRAEAARFIEGYFALYPGVKRWIEAMLEEARARGYVETLMGRRRLTPDLLARNGMIRGNAERIAVNTPIQGTCADMIKKAMLAIGPALAKAAPGSRMVCQVHDELVFSVPRAELDAVKTLVRREMEGALPLAVPVQVDIGAGPNWAQTAA